MSKIEGNNSVKGYKVFNPDWTCSPNGHMKQYTCPGMFEEDVEPKVGYRGMHFCEKLVVCFKDYNFNPENRVAEVVAYGDIDKDEDRFCTNKLEIVRELTWEEVLRVVNIGENCTGFKNSGDRNSGNYNSGNYNNGNRNSGNYNTGDQNGGDQNSGDQNSGDHNDGSQNSGDYNSGNCNVGNYNDGSWNIGDYNSGNCNVGNYNDGSWNISNYNSGNCNVGNYNDGSWNIGDYNSGNCNTGDQNSGHDNSGDWNTADHTNGCFNTTSQFIYLFNKVSNWTMDDWKKSKTKKIMKDCPPEKEDRQDWWDNLDNYDKNAIKDIPNFDPKIFKEITEIDVNRGVNMGKREEEKK